MGDKGLSHISLLCETISEITNIVRDARGKLTSPQYLLGQVQLQWNPGQVAPGLEGLSRLRRGGLHLAIYRVQGRQGLPICVSCTGLFQMESRAFDDGGEGITPTCLREAPWSVVPPDRPAPGRLRSRHNAVVDDAVSSCF